MIHWAKQVLLRNHYTKASCLSVVTFSIELQLLTQWCIVSIFNSGLYYGLVGRDHIKKRWGANERFALITDIIVFILLLIYVLLFFN